MKHVILYDYIKILLKSANWYIERIDNNDHDGVNEDSLIISIIINSWVALEAFINYIASIAKYAKKLSQHEASFLNETKLKIDDNGKSSECKEYHSTAIKILFLLNKFSSTSSEEFKRTKLWENIKRSEILRNELIHPKEDSNLITLNIKTAKFVNNTVRETIVYLNNKTLKAKKII